MINYTKKDIRTLSLLGQRGAFGKCLADIADTNTNIFAITADQARGVALNRFKDLYPDRYLNMGISEQNAIGVASGLAECGYIPFVAFQAAFITLRCADQVKVNLSYMQSNVKLIGIFSGLTQSDCGPTHYANQDIALMRAFPNIMIFSPCDALETVKIIESVSHINSPVYVRVSGEINSPVVYKDDYNFEVGKAIILKDGVDVAIITTGTMVNNSLKAAKLLEEKGISVKVVNMHTIKPLDIETIKECCNTKLIVSIEEHSIFGGLGGAIAESLSEKESKPIHLIMGLSDVNKQAGEYSYLLEQYDLTPERISDKIFLKMEQCKLLK